MLSFSKSVAEASMRNTKFPVRTNLDERLRVAVSPEEKQRLFELAASRQKSASELIRDAIAATFFSEQRAA